MLLEHHVGLSLDKLLPYFTDLKKFGSIHPHIRAVEETADGIKITESLKVLGFIPSTNVYTVNVERSADCIIYKSQVKKNIYLEITFRFESGGDKTKITETINITAPFLVKKILMKTLIDAHTQLIQKLKAIRLV